MIEGSPGGVVAIVLSNLGDEICKPLDRLRDELRRIMDGPDEAQLINRRKHASTMITLCDELGRLTRDTLGPGEMDGLHR